jgi:hypothetical protein
MPWVNINNLRRIRIANGRGTQSVNICTQTNTPGEYEQVFYFRGTFRVTPQQVEQYGDLPTLVSWLRRRSYDQLQ